MRVFVLIWFGQLISLLGSNLTNFALDIWVYQRTGSITQFALISLSTSLPLVIISPVAGALVDRCNRRWAMIFSDCGAALSILAIAVLLIFGRLEIWHIYIAGSLNSIFNALQWPAYNASITLLIPKQHLSRANGMIQLAGALPELIAPMLGGVLLEIIQLQGIILLDFASFLFSLITLLRVRFPNLKSDATKKAGKSSLLQEIAYAWKYITRRPGLLGLLILFAICNFLMGIFMILLTPLVLSFSSPSVLGTILSVGGIGMLVGTLITSTWGGASRLIYGILCFEMLGGLCIFVAGLRTSVPILSLAVFLFSFGLAIINSYSQVIWQRKVPPEVQGRVFAVRRMISGSSLPLAYLIAGPLAEKVFEPLMLPNSPVGGSIGQLIGVGHGRGIGLLFIVMGTLYMLAAIAAYQYPPLRLVEDELPDAI